MKPSIVNNPASYVARMIVVLTLAVPGIASAQTWSTTFPAFDDTYWHGVSFSDSLTGTVVGSSGKIYRTTNGGTSWSPQTSGITILSESLHDVSFVDANIGTAVGNGYTSRIILRTTDGGANWASQTSAATAYDRLFGVSFADSSHGIAVGINLGLFGNDYKYVILRTSDGGTNWTRTVTSGGALWKVSFPDTNHATAVGDSGRIYRTTNGGATWTQQTSGTSNHLQSVSFLDSSNGTAVGNSGTILRTTNGGTSWTAQSSGTSALLLGVSFFDADNGIAVGSGVILRTNNGGTNWVHQQGTSIDFWDAVLRTIDKGTIAARSGRVLSTSDGSTMLSATATTSAATSVNMTTATVGGVVNAKGAITTVRFLRGTTSGSYTDSVTASVSPISGSASLSNASVSYPLSGLSPSTTYYFRVVAENFMSYVRGAELSFTTFADVAPTVSTNSPTSVGFDNATLSGTVQTHGPSTVVRFVWGTSAGVYTDSVVAAQSPISDSTISAVSAAIAGLDTAETYYVRVAASNALYYVRGTEVSFSTKPILAPTVAVTTPGNTGPTSATVNGTINSHGLLTSVRFLRGTVSGTYTDSVTALQSPVTDSTSNVLSALMTALSPSTTYYVRVAATNGYYYVRSSETYFSTTTLNPPAVTTSSASMIGGTSASLNGSVHSYGVSTVVRFLYGTSSGVYSDSVLAVESPLSGLVDQTVSASLTGLSPNTKYYVRAAASNGTYSSLGTERSFTTYAGSSAGWALGFDGSDDHVQTDLTDIGGNELTIEYWFKGSTPQSAVRQQNGSGYIVAGWNDPPVHILSNDGGAGAGLSLGASVNDGNWHHVAMTWKRNTANGFVSYLDGSIVDQRTSSDDPIPSLGSSVHLGSFDGSSEFTNGTMDQVRIWSVSRTQQQIREGMHRNLSGSTANLTAYFEFNEGTGSTTSSTAGSVTGTLGGGPTWVASSVPAGEGTSASVASFTSGTATMGSLSVTTSEAFDNAVDLTTTALPAAPNALPSGYESIVGQKYFIVRTFGDPETFAASVAISFGGGVLPSQANAVPAGIKLYSRSSNSDGAWSAVGGADSADAASGYVRWSGLTSFSQFAAVVDSSALFPLPAVTTSAVTQITTESAKLNGSVTAYGVATTVRFLIGVTSQAYTDSVTIPQSPVSAVAATVVSLDLLGRPPGTNYYVRLAASNAYRYVRGDEVTFTTSLPESSGSALTFDGSNDHVQTDLTDIGGNELTIEYWFKGSNPQSAVRQQSGLGFVVAGWSDPPVHILSNDGGAGAGLSLGASVKDGNWHHVAMTWKRNTANGFVSYLDGSIVDQRTSSDNPIPSLGSSVHLGSFDGSSEFTNGTMDEVRIWNVARTQAQIRENMHRVVTSSTGLVAYFKLNEGSGSTTVSQVGSHVGNVLNGAAWTTSTVPLATGTSGSSSGAITNGTEDLGLVTVTTTEAFDNAVSLTATMLYGPPNTLSGVSGTQLDDWYWVLNAFGTPGAFAANLTFDVPATFTNNGAASAANYTLYHRSGNSEGAWTSAVSGASALTSTTITFNGVTSFSQFAIGTSDPLPVQMVGMKAEVGGRGSEVRLSWSTASEVDNAGWEVERRETSMQYGVGSREKDGWVSIGFVEGAGTSTSPREYQFVDDVRLTIHDSRLTGSFNRFAYRLKQIDRNGSVSYSHEVEVEVGSAPRELTLGDSYPNPFNPSTTIEFTLPDDGRATLKIYNMLGQEVATLVNGDLKAGVVQRATFNADRLPTGIYFSRLEFGGTMLLKRMMLVK